MSENLFDHENQNAMSMQDAIIPELAQYRLQIRAHKNMLNALGLRSLSDVHNSIILLQEQYIKELEHALIEARKAAK